LRIAYIALKGMPLGGGIESFTREVGRRLAARGHEVVAYCTGHFEARPGRFEGMEVRVVPSVNTRSLQKMSACAMATLRELSGRSDIVHYHALGPSMVSWLPRLRGVKTVVQIHGQEWKRAKWGLAGRLFLKASDLSVYFPHRLTAVSRTLCEEYGRRFGREVVHIPTGVNAVTRRPPDLITKEYGLKGEDYVFFAARLVAEKGAHYLIEAFRGLDTDLKLVIAGDAQHEELYKKKLREMTGGDSRIVFTGFVTGQLLEELFSSARVYVLPSEIEGLPVSLLEAMSYGNCCLVSDIPENLEALGEEGGTGFTFRGKDAEDLRRKLSWLLAHPEETLAVRDRARMHVMANYSWDSVAERLERFYVETIEGSFRGATAPTAKRERGISPGEVS
jgi:glycosyltransferase involved in cell wall biosynthesis